MIRKAYIPLIIIIVVFSAATFSQEADILKQIKEAGTSKDWGGSPVVVVFDKTEVEVKPNGLSLVEKDYLIKVLALEGIRQFPSLRFNYDPASNMIEIREITIYRKSGQVEKIDLKKTTRDLPQPQSSIIWGARMKVVAIPRLNVGDALRYKTFKKGFEIAYLAAQEDDDRYIPPLVGEFYDKIYFTGRNPIKYKSYKLKIPKDKSFQYKVYNGELTSTKNFDDKFYYYTWSKKNIPPHKRGQGEVGSGDTETKLIISNLPNWKEKSKWFYNANKNQFKVSEAIQKKVDQLTKGLKTDEEKIAVLNHWVAQYIRYMGLSMGKGEGYTVHSGIMTYADRAGVCKDKAGMLATMMFAAGLEARVAMTMAGGKVEDVPADQFNHCVTIWKRKDNDYVLLDPTWIPYSREMWSSAEQEQQYLIGDVQGVDLKTTPAVPAEDMLVKINDSSSLDTSGNLKGTITLEAHGLPEQRLRRLLARYPNRQKKEFFHEMLSAISRHIRITNYSHTGLTDFSQPLLMKVEYAVENYTVGSKENTLFVPPLAKNILHMPYVTRWVNYAKPDKRKSTVDNWGTFHYVFNGTTTLPGDIKIKFIPPKKKVEGEAAEYTYSTSAEKNTVKLSQSIKIKKRFVAPEEYLNYRDAIRSFAEAANNTLVLSR